MREVGGVSFFDGIEEILRPEHTALVVVDMQNDFCSTEGHFAHAGRDVSRIAAIVPAIATLVGTARSLGVPVIHIMQTTLADFASDSPAWMYFKTRDGKAPNYTMDGSWGQEIVPELAPNPGEPVVKKHRPSAFRLTTLDLVLRNKGIATVAICGCITQGCVQATTMDASFHDYYAVLVKDCVQSTNQELHENALRFLGSRYDMVTSEELARIWSSPQGGSVERRTVPQAHE